jgi:hypothetical protein
MWEPLLAIAEVAGGEWPERARRAAIGLSAGRDDDDEALGIELLRDIRDQFSQPGHSGKVWSMNLVTHLKARPDGDYGERNFGRGINQKDIARLLKPFGIAPKTVRMGGDTKKGYERDQFKEAFERFLGSSESAEDAGEPTGSVEEF